MSLKLLHLQHLDPGAPEHLAGSRLYRPHVCNVDGTRLMVSQHIQMYVSLDSNHNMQLTTTILSVSLSEVLHHLCLSASLPYTLG